MLFTQAQRDERIAYLVTQGWLVQTGDTWALTQATPRQEYQRLAGLVQILNDDAAALMQIDLALLDDMELDDLEQQLKGE